MQSILAKIKSKKPLIFSITNYVTMNDCANAILAIGGSPIMSFELREVEELVKMSNVLYINIGTITKDQQKTIFKSIKVAKEFSKPIVIDPVGCGATTYRTKLTKKIIKESIKLTGVIKGNVSEIKSLVDETVKTRGVDANEKDILLKEQIIDLSKSTNKTIIATGKKDMIANSDEYIEVSGGSKSLKLITGSGCMLGAVISCFVAEDKKTFNAVKNASHFFKLSSEKISLKSYSGSFRTDLINNLSKTGKSNDK